MTLRIPKNVWFDIVNRGELFTPPVYDVVRHTVNNRVLFSVNNFAFHTVNNVALACARVVYAPTITSLNFDLISA